MQRYQAVVIGMSAGGSEALMKILSCLPADYPLPLVIVQHLHPQQNGPALFYTARGCVLQLKEADDKEPVRGGVVYFAPPNYHLLIEQNATLSLNIDPKVNFTRPSIDVLFESAADAYGSALIGVVLSGANHDGAAGLAMIKQMGGFTIVQDPGTAGADFMPREAIAAAVPNLILTPGEIGLELIRLAHLQKENDLTQ